MAGMEKGPAVFRPSEGRLALKKVTPSHPLHQTVIQGSVKHAGRQANLSKRVSCHTACRSKRRAKSGLLRRTRSQVRRAFDDAGAESIRMSFPRAGAVLGVDVGDSETRRTTCFCLLKWTAESASVAFSLVTARPAERRASLKALLGSVDTLASVAIDRDRSMAGVRHRLTTA